MQKSSGRDHNKLEGTSLEWILLLLIIRNSLLPSMTPEVNKCSSESFGVWTLRSDFPAKPAEEGEETGKALNED